MRFVTNEDSPPLTRRAYSWSSGSQVSSNTRPGPTPLEVWAPSLTLGRDGPGIILKDGKGPILRKGLETAISDFYSNPQKPVSSQPVLSAALSAQFSPTRYGGSMWLSYKHGRFEKSLLIWQTLGSFCFPDTEWPQRIWPKQTPSSVCFKESWSSSTGSDLMDGSLLLRRAAGRQDYFTAVFFRPSNVSADHEFPL